MFVFCGIQWLAGSTLCHSSSGKTAHLPIMSSMAAGLANTWDRRTPQSQHNLSKLCFFSVYKRILLSYWRSYKNKSKYYSGAELGGSCPLSKKAFSPPMAPQLLYNYWQRLILIQASLSTCNRTPTWTVCPGKNNNDKTMCNMYFWSYHL